MPRNDENVKAVPKPQGCSDAACWALWRLSQILAEIAQNQSGVTVKEPTAATQTGFEVSSAEGSTND
jgi:hypothetical protein